MGTLLVNSCLILWTSSWNLCCWCNSLVGVELWWHLFLYFWTHPLVFDAITGTRSFVCTDVVICHQICETKCPIRWVSSIPVCKWNSKLSAVPSNFFGQMIPICHLIRKYRPHNLHNHINQRFILGIFLKKKLFSIQHMSELPKVDMKGFPSLHRPLEAKMYHPDGALEQDLSHALLGIAGGGWVWCL